jgi:mono/diheme cytochrome c family protein
MALAALYLLKLAIARRYRQYLRYAAPLGLTIATLMLVVYVGSAGYYVLHTALAGRPLPSESPSGLSAEADRGRTIFAELCSDCHYADRDSRKIGPGLKGLLKRPALPESGRPATPENVLSQLKKPLRTMPSFARLSEGELTDLLAYLQTI